MYSADKPAAPANGLESRVPWDQRLARVLIRPFAGTGLTPNQVTTLSLFAGLAGGWFFAQGGSAIHLGAALFALSIFMDHMDGELARMTNQTSRFGAVFDQAADGIVKIVLFCAIGAGLMGGAFGDWTLPMGLVAGLAVAAIFTLRFEIERRRSSNAVRQPKFAGFEIEDIMYLVAPITWLGGLLPFLVLSSIGAPLFLIYQIWVFWRQPPDGIAAH